jgi:hypothetical protein
MHCSGTWYYMGLLFRIFTAGLNQNCNSEKCLNHYWKNAVFFLTLFLCLATIPLMENLLLSCRVPAVNAIILIRKSEVCTCYHNIFIFSRIGSLCIIFSFACCFIALYVLERAIR